MYLTVHAQSPTFESKIITRPLSDDKTSAVNRSSAEPIHDEAVSDDEWAHEHMRTPSAFILTDGNGRRETPHRTERMPILTAAPRIEHPRPCDVVQHHARVDGPMQETIRDPHAEPNRMEQRAAQHSTP
ncbi:hypothetical protein K3495_g4250 [Podosphaera aphanis]|nr:hypothetical protein K3495_g4250 [Podosphaera aphanis]